jgi:hypothetical protein
MMMMMMILASINPRNVLFKEKLKNPSNCNKLAYSKHRNCLNVLIRQSKILYFQQQLKIHKTNSKKMWELLNTLTCKTKDKRNENDTFVSESGSLMTSGSEIADSFNNFFISVGQEIQNNIPNSTVDPLEYISFNNSHALVEWEPSSVAELQTIISEMKNVGAGIDNISASLFKQTYNSIIHQLLHLINICLKKGIFPDNLKLAVVKPIFKAGSKDLLNNYRPISILPCLSKILEKNYS